MAKIKLKKPNLKFKKPTKAGFIRTIKSTKFLVSLMVILALGGFGYSGYYWYQNKFIDPDEIFYGMIDKSLSTQSITRTIEQEGGGRTEEQVVFVRFTPDTMMQSRTTLQQINANRQSSVVKTESLGTRDADYVRYTDIVIPQADGSNADYSSALNTWAVREGTGENASASFLNEAIFTFIPFGNFPDKERAEMVNKLRDRNVYEMQGNKISYETGRPVFSTTIFINPRGLVEVMRQYAELTGVGDISQLDPEQYQDENIFNIRIEVDVISRHLTKIEYPNGERTENFQAYGLTRQFSAPENAVTLDELQGRLQQIQ